jgi:hypothetical protein
MLTASQMITLHLALVGDSTMAEAVANADDIAIAAWCNAPVAEKCWKTKLTIDEVQDAMNWTTFIGRSTGERDAFRTMFSQGEVNPAKSNVRTGLDDIFSGTAAQAVALRAALSAVSQRTMTRAEKILATGPVSSVYTLTFEGHISYADASVLR